jgi:hypothetical protein
MLENGEISLQPKPLVKAQTTTAAMCNVRSNSECAPELPNGPGMRPVPERYRGVLVCEDPPNIVVFRFQGQKQWITWVDVRNYSAIPPSSYGNGNDMATWIGEWFANWSRSMKDYGMGSLQHTAASQSMYGFRRSYLRSSIYVSTDDSASNLEYSAYCGGRCEAYSIGTAKERVYHLDVRSMYPAICSRIDVPVRLATVVDIDETVRTGSRELLSASIAQCDVSTDESAYPAKREGITIWPTGKFRAVLCGPELVDAYDHGRIVRIYRLARYHMEPALRDYAMGLYKLREQAENGQYQLCDSSIKHLLVALPGKLGQRERGWREVPGVWSDIQWGEWYGSDLCGRPCRYRSLGGYTQAEVDLGWAPQAVPAIAAWVCSQGRIILLAYIRIAGWENVLYVDTDSLYVNEVGYERLKYAGVVSSSGIGSLVLKGPPATLRVTAIKHYDYGTRRVCSGLPKGTITDNGDGSTYYWSPTPAGDARRGHKPEAKRILMHYALSSDYQHGVVMSDGRVLPHRLEEF